MRERRRKRKEEGAGKWSTSSGRRSLFPAAADRLSLSHFLSRFLLNFLRQIILCRLHISNVYRYCSPCAVVYTVLALGIFPLFKTLPVSPFIQLTSSENSKNKTNHQPTSPKKERTHVQYSAVFRRREDRGGGGRQLIFQCIRGGGGGVGERCGLARPQWW